VDGVSSYSERKKGHVDRMGEDGWPNIGLHVLGEGQNTKELDSGISRTTNIIAA